MEACPESVEGNAASQGQASLASTEACSIQGLRLDAALCATQVDSYPERRKRL